MARADETVGRADETMLSQAEREMDLKTFIREQNLWADKRFTEFKRRMDHASDQLRANTAATWAMVDEIRGRGTA